MKILQLNQVANEIPEECWVSDGGIFFRVDGERRTPMVMQYDPKERTSFILFSNGVRMKERDAHKIASLLDFD